MVRFKNKKLGISNVIKSKEFTDLIFTDVKRLHLLNIFVSHFIKFYCIYSFNHNIPLVDISDKAILYKFYSIFIIGKCKTDYLKPVWDQYKQYIPSQYLESKYFSRLSNHANDYCSLQYATCIKNNIVIHYTTHVKHFIHSQFITIKENNRSIVDKTERVTRQKYTRQQLDLLLKYFLDPSLEPVNLDAYSLSIFNLHKDKFVSFLDDKKQEQILLEALDIDKIKLDYTRLLTTMIYMSQFTETHYPDIKILQPVPLYSNLTPNNAMFDSRCLAITCNKYNTDEIKQSNVHDIWNLVFNTESKQWRFSKNYIFTGMCHTDGLSISLQFIHQNDYDKYMNKKIARSQAGVKVKQMTVDEKASYEQERKDKQTQYKVEQTKKKQEAKKKLSKPPKQGIMYIDSVDTSILSKLSKVYIDPGNNSLLHMINDIYLTTTTKKEKENNSLEYTRKYRYHECGFNTRKKETRKRLDSNKDMVNFQQTMSKTKRKSSVMTTYIEYIKVFFNHIANDKFVNCYDETWWRYQKLRAYGMTKKHEQELLNKIEAKFGKDTIYIIGDHSVHSMKGIASSKGVGLKRLLKERFAHVYLIDEYNTSKLYWKTQVEGEQWYSHEARSYEATTPKKKCRRGKGVELKRYPNKSPSEKIDNDIKGRKIHALKKFQTSKGLSVCINRDLNAVLGMRYIVSCMLEYGKRPIEYTRKQTTTLESAQLSGITPIQTLL